MLNTFRVIFVDSDGKVIGPDVTGCQYTQTGDDVYFSLDWGNPIDVEPDTSGTGVSEQYAYDNRTINDMFRKYSPYVPFPRSYGGQGVNPPGDNPLPAGEAERADSPRFVNAGRTGELIARSNYKPMKTFVDGSELSRLLGDTPYDFSRDRGITTDMRVPSFFFTDSERDLSSTTTQIVDFGDDDLVSGGQYDIKITQSPSRGTSDTSNEIDIQDETKYPQWIYIGLVGAGGPGGCKLAGINTTNNPGGGGGTDGVDTNTAACFGGDRTNPIICLCPRFDYNIGDVSRMYEAFEDVSLVAEIGAGGETGLPAIVARAQAANTGEDGIQGGVFLRVCGDESDAGRRKNIVVRVKSLGKGGVESFEARKRPGNPADPDDESQFIDINRAKTDFPTRASRDTEVEVYAIRDGATNITPSSKLLTIKAEGGRARAMKFQRAPDRECRSTGVRNWCRQCGDPTPVGDDAYSQQCLDAAEIFTPLVNELSDDESSPVTFAPVFSVIKGPAFDDTKYEYIASGIEGIDRGDDGQVSFPIQLQDPDVGIRTRSDWFTNSGQIQKTPRTLTFNLSGSGSEAANDPIRMQSVEGEPFVDSILSRGQLSVTPEQSEYIFNGDTEYTFIQDDGSSPPIILQNYTWSEVQELPAQIDNASNGFDLSIKYRLDGSIVTPEEYVQNFDQASSRRINFKTPRNMVGNFLVFNIPSVAPNFLQQAQINRSTTEMIPNPGLGGIWNAMMMTNGAMPTPNQFVEGAGGNGGAVYFGMGQKINTAALSDYSGEEPLPDDPPSGGGGNPDEIVTLLSGAGFKLGDSAGTLQDGSTPPMDPVSIYDDPSEDPYAYEFEGALRSPGDDAVAIARWTKIPYVTRNNDFYITLQAEHGRGIKEVQFSVNGSNWTSISERKAYPTDLPESKSMGLGRPSPTQDRENGYEEYIARVDIDSVREFFDREGDGSGFSEIRARVIPNVGVPLILQGNLRTKYDVLENVECGIARYGRFVQERDPNAEDPNETYEVFKPYMHKRTFGTDYEISPWYQLIREYDGTENFPAISPTNPTGYTPQEMLEERQAAHGTYADVPGGITFGYFPQDYDPNLNEQNAYNWLYIDRADIPDGTEGIIDTTQTEIYFEEVPEGETVYVKGVAGEIVRWDSDTMGDEASYTTKFIRAASDDAEDSLLYAPNLYSNRNTLEYFRSDEISDKIRDGLCGFHFNVFESGVDLNYYVDSKFGDDELNNGSALSPFRTIGKAIEDAGTGWAAFGGTITLKGTADTPRVYDYVSDAGIGLDGDPEGPFRPNLSLPTVENPERNKVIVIEGEEQDGVILTTRRTGADKNATGEFTVIALGRETHVVIKNVTIKAQLSQRLIAPTVVAVDSEGNVAQTLEEVADFKHTNEYDWDATYSGIYDWTKGQVSTRIFSGQSASSSLALIDCFITINDQVPEITEGSYWTNYDWNNPGDYIVYNGDNNYPYRMDDPPGSSNKDAPDPTISNGYGAIKVPFPKKGDKFYFGSIMDVADIFGYGTPRPLFQEGDDAGFDENDEPRDPGIDLESYRSARKGPLVDLRAFLLPEGTNDASGLDWPGVEIEQDYNYGMPYSAANADRHTTWQRFVSIGNFQTFISYNCTMKQTAKGPDGVYMSKHDKYDTIHWDVFSSNPGAVFNFEAYRHTSAGDYSQIHTDFFQTFDFSGNPLTREAVLENRMFCDVKYTNSGLQVANLEGNKYELPNTYEWRHWSPNTVDKQGRALNPFTAQDNKKIFKSVFRNWAHARWIFNNDRTYGWNKGVEEDHAVYEDILAPGVALNFSGSNFNCGRRDFRKFYNFFMRNLLCFQFKFRTATPNCIADFDGAIINDNDLNRDLQFYPYPTHATPFQDLLPDVQKDNGSYSRAGWVGNDGNKRLVDSQIIENVYTTRTNDALTVVSDQDLEYYRPNLGPTVTTYRRPDDGQMFPLPPSKFDVNTNSFDVPSSQPTKNNPEYRNYCDTLAEDEAQLFQGCTAPWGVNEQQVIDNVDVGPNGSPAPGGTGFPTGGNFYWGGGFSEFAWLYPPNQGFEYGIWGKYSDIRGECCRRLVDVNDLDNDGNVEEFVDLPEVEHWGPFDATVALDCKPVFWYDQDQLDLRNRNRSRKTDEYPDGTPLLDNWPRGNNTTDWSDRP